MLKRFFQNPYLYLGVIIIIGFLVRLYKIDNPIADWHSWRQADTAAVARNFYKNGFNPLVPIYDDMSSVSEKPAPNPHRYRFVEFPIYNSLIFFTYLLNGGVDERLARLVTIFISLGSTIFIYLITKRYFSTATALLASFLFAVLPYNIYYSRVILPDPMMVFFSLAGFYFIDRWIFEEKRYLLVWGLILAGSAFLLKPYAIFYFLPLVYSVYQKERRLWPPKRKYLLFVVFSLLPFIVWRIWISRHPEGIPASSWLFNGNNIRFRPAFWQWIIDDRFRREILSPLGMILLSIGILVKPKPKEGILLQLFLLSSFVYLAVLATGNVQHDYYQILIIPALVIFVARGFTLLFGGIRDFIPRIWTIPIALFFLVYSLYFCWGQIKSLYNINNPAIVEAGKEADRILPKEAKVVAPYDGDTAFLYQTNRPGFPLLPESVEDLVSKYGVSYYISVSKDAETQKIMSKYKVLEDKKDYVIVDLTAQNPPR